MDEHVRDRTTDSGQPAGLKRTVSAREAAVALGLNERTIRRAIARGDLPASKEAGVFRINPADLAKYREYHRIPTAIPVRTVTNPPRLIPLPRRMKDSTSAPPSPLTELIGRDHELEVANGLLRRSGVRLITLTGPGGVGKTRLAIQIAGSIAGSFPAGVCFVPLAPVPGADLVATSIASALNLRERGDRSIRDLLVATLRERDALLVLDNFEHVLEAGHLVTDLLEHCPKLRILVTSRMLLRVAGEHALPVPPLGLPNALAASSPEDLTRVEAVRLFTERAKAVAPAFTLSVSTAPLIADICHMLDGLPLAIELAAARLTHVPLATLRERLARRLPLLSRGGGSSDRHHTLRNAIAWSYDLLSPNEQMFFRRLAVFAGGFALEAAESISRDVDASPAITVLDSIGSLTDASLLRQEAGSDGTARYLMLETIREYAVERLAESDEKDAVYEAHAAYFLSFATRYELAELLPNGDEAVAHLDAENANLRSALAWLEAADESGRFPRLAAALGRYWYGQGHFQEGRNWLERALNQGGASAPADQAKARTLLGIIASYQGARDAETNLSEGLAICGEVGDTLHATYALFFLGALTTFRGDLDRASALLTEALATAHTVVDQRLARIVTSLSLINLSVLDRRVGNRELATDRLQESLRLLRDAGHTPGIVLVLSDLGDMARDDGDFALASRIYQDALVQVRESTGTRIIIDTIESVATVAAAVGLAEQSARLLGASDALRDQIGYRLRSEAHQAACERAIATIRAALSESVFATAWAAGRALHVEQAISEAFAPISPPAVAPGVLLTPREAEILPLLAAGLTDREIGAVLYLSHRTVGNHVTRIMAKLGAHTRATAIKTARAQGLFPGV